MSARKAARKIADAQVVGMAPDVCKTPMGSATPPIPYSVTAKLHLSSSVSPDVNFTQCPAFTINSNTSKTWGDEPGEAKGVKSGTVGGKAEPIGKSSTVRVNGQWLVRHDDLFYLNEKNTVGKLVYPGGSPVASMSGPGLSPQSIPKESVGLFSQRGLLNKLAEVGKSLAMEAVMGGNPLESLKTMVNPMNIVKGQLNNLVGGALQSTGPIGSLIGNQLLGEVNKQLTPSNTASSSQQSPGQSSSPQLLNNVQLAQKILGQTNHAMQPSNDHASRGLTKASTDALLAKTNLPSAVADSIVPVILGGEHQLKRPLTPYGKQAVKQGRDVMKQSTNALLTLAAKEQLAPPTDFRGLFAGIPEPKTRM